MRPLRGKPRLLIRPGDPAVPGAVWRRVGLLVGPLALQGILFKLIKYAVLTREGARALPRAELVTALFLDHAIVPLLLCGVGLCVGALVLARWPGLLPAVVPLFFGVVAGGGTVVDTVLSAHPPWLSVAFFEVIRADLLFAGVMALVFLCWLGYTEGRLRRAGVYLLHGLVLVLMLLSSMEFGYFVLTGSLADAYLLRYSMGNMGNLSFALSHELSGSKLIFMALPFVVVMLPMLVERMRRSRRERQYGLRAIWAPVLMLWLAPHGRVPDQVAMIRDNPFVQWVEEAFRTPVWESEAVTRLARNETPLFDTHALRLEPTPKARRMNVVLVIMESTRARSVTPYAPDLPTTPFLDSLSRHAALVEHMYAVVPHTNKALVPLLCGIYPHLSQDDDPAIPGRCLPALLQQQGYATAFFTPAKLSFENKGVMLANMGFETRAGDGAYPDPEGFSQVNYFGREDRVMLRPTLDWVDRQVAADRPFFLTLLTLTSHHPYGVPHRRRMHPFTDPGSDENAYLNTLAYTDAFARDLYRSLTARGLDDNTLFIFIGDHGEAFGEHGRRFHSAVVWEEGLHVPALLVNPVLIPEATRITGNRQQIDVLPTIASALGMDLAGGVIPGRSLFNAVPEDRKLYHAGWIENQSMALREGPRKIVYHFRRQEMEVYDLGTDPFEQQNRVASFPEERRAAWEMELLLWRKRVNERYRDSGR